MDSEIITNQKPAKKRGRRSTQQTPGREALLKAAISVFSQRSYEGASLRMIAKRADVDMALVARIFGSKLKLWQSVVLELSEKQSCFRESIRAIPENYQNNPSLGFRVFVETFTDLCIELPEQEAFFMQETINGTDRIDFIKQHIVDPFMAVCLPVIKWFIQNKVVQTDNPVLLLKMMFAAISVPLFSLEALEGHEQANLREDIIDETTRQFSVNIPT